MDEFNFTIIYKGRAFEFPAKVITTGYTTRLAVEIEGGSVIFEPDEEQNWRAVVNYEDIIQSKKMDSGLLEAIAAEITNAIK